MVQKENIRKDNKRITFAEICYKLNIFTLLLILICIVGVLIIIYFRVNVSAESKQNNADSIISRIDLNKAEAEARAKSIKTAETTTVYVNMPMETSTYTAVETSPNYEESPEEDVNDSSSMEYTLDDESERSNFSDYEESNNESEAENAENYENESYFWYPGEVLTSNLGCAMGPNGPETYYNLDMSGVLEILEQEGLGGEEYWVNSDGIKMYGDYVMLAGHISDGVRRRGEIVQTTVGLGMICDDIAESDIDDPMLIDVATIW